MEAFGCIRLFLLPLPQLILQAIRHSGHDLHRRIILIRGLNDRPRRISRIRALEHLLIHGQISVVLLIPLPVRFGHPPGCLPVLCKLFKTFFLLFSGDIEKQLDNHASAVGELLFKGQDIAKRPFKLPALYALVKPILCHAAVPAPVENGNPPVLRRPGPVTPQKRAHPLLLARFPAGIHIKASGIQRLNQPVYLHALPRGIQALEHNDHRNLLRLAFPLQDAKARAQLVAHPLIGLPVHTLFQIHLLQHMFPLLAKISGLCLTSRGAASHPRPPTCSHAPFVSRGTVLPNPSSYYMALKPPYNQCARPRPGAAPV